MNNDGITLPPWTKLIPRDIPGWYWVMRQGMWPKCIRCIMGANVIKPAEPRDGFALTEYTHFIGPVAEPDDIVTKNVFCGERLFFKEKRRARKYRSRKIGHE